jgi:16S rRNA (uracil1498-N3)-methyltransferase
MRLFSEVPVQAHSLLRLSTPMYQHLRALRVRPGDSLVVFDGRGGEFTARYEGRESVAILEHRCVDREWPVQLIVAHALCSTERSEWALQKSVEMGATTYIPLLSKHSQPFPNGERGEKRRQRWLSIIQSASEQCGRNRLMELEEAVDFYQLIRRFHGKDFQAYMFEPSDTPANLPPPIEQRNSLLWIGPEGGWHVDEIAESQFFNVQLRSLGPSILRSETAVVAALAHITATWRFS